MFKNLKLPFRYIAFIGGGLVALLAHILTDPDLNVINLPFGAVVVSRLTAVLASAWGVLILYIGTKSIFDWLDMGKITDKAMETPEGAGYVFIGVAISRMAIAIVIGIFAFLFS